MNAADKLAPNDTISREAAVAAVDCPWTPDREPCPCVERTRDALRSLPAAEPRGVVVADGIYRSDYGIVESKTTALAMFNQSPGRSSAGKCNGKRVRVIVEVVE